MFGQTQACLVKLNTIARSNKLEPANNRFFKVTPTPRSIAADSLQNDPSPSAMPRFLIPTKPKGHRCTHCRRHPYAQLGRLVAHVQKRHPTEWLKDLKAMEEEGDESSVGDPSTRESTPSATPSANQADQAIQVQHAANYQRLLIGLMRPLTSLETRLRTTNQIDENDYDSDDDSGPTNDDFVMQTSEPESSSQQEPPSAPPPAATQHLEEYPTEVKEIGIDMSNQSFDLATLWRPFRNGYEFKLARWFMDAMVSKKWIDLFFNDGLAREPPPNMDGSEGECFTSSYTLCNLLDDLDPDLAPSSWKPWAIDHHGVGLIEFRYRSVEKMIRHIFKQQSHTPYMVYKPVREYTAADKEYRLFSELHTAEWWWKMQVSLIPPQHSSISR